VFVERHLTVSELFSKNSLLFELNLLPSDTSPTERLLTLYYLGKCSPKYLSSTCDCSIIHWRLEHMDYCCQVVTNRESCQPLSVRYQNLQLVCNAAEPKPVKLASPAFRCKGKGLDTCYSAIYMSQTRDQQRFTISEVAADWHEQWCRSALSGHLLPALTDNWTYGAARRHTIAPISHTRPSPRSRS